MFVWLINPTFTSLAVAVAAAAAVVVVVVVVIKWYENYRPLKF